MLEQIEELIKQAVESVEDSDSSKLEITPATQEKFGDYQTNIALQHAKVLRRAPIQIAEEFKNSIPENNLIEKVEVAPPGFLNIHLKKSYIDDMLIKVSEDEHLGVEQLSEASTVVLDYSSPNIAKTMHVAHLRSTIIGDALKRIFQARGYKTIADNHLGDWGTQFGKLLYAYKNFDADYGVPNESIEFLEKLYQDFVARSKEDESLNDRAREEVAALQRKEEPNYSLWKKFIEISLEEFQTVYDRLDVKFDRAYGESHYNDDLAGVLSDLQSKGVCKESEGAQVVFFANDELPPIPVQKRDGSFLYSTTDIATVKDRIDNDKPAQILYVTDNRQKLHFRQVFSISSQLGYECDFVHIPFGLMKFGEGAIMSTKEGQVISLKSFLDEAQNRSFEKLDETLKGADYSEDYRKEIARVVGTAAVKYQDLSQNPGSDITFTWEKALNLEGNSAPYLLYSYARIQAMYRKYVAQFGELTVSVKPAIHHHLEKRIALQILGFDQAVKQASSLYRPNIIADYVYNLSSRFATFYNQVSILKEEDPEIRASRMALALLTARVLQRGLQLLGIETLDRM